ncbi:MAG: formylglycine-generating enzyme family protein, partial [Parvularculaceae bacterium]|nr:formylglycine-generating enzyme family protein [Parvularculaceae bacterium]
AAAPAPVPAPEAPPKPAAPAQTAAVAGAKRDCDVCPLMASLPGGSFMMGSPEDEPGRNPYEGPQHEVTIKPFRIGVYEVTVGEWGQCVADGACEAKPGSDPNLPVLRVSWNEAKAYVRWLSGKSGKTYRLPSEAEWEYAARAGTTTPWHWGDRFDATQLARGEVKPVGSYGANAFGLHDMLSNAREWAEDCYVNNFTQTPRDGSASKTGDCSVRVVLGGGAASGPLDTRVANRIRNKPGDQIRYMGLRVAAD